MKDISLERLQEDKANLDTLKRELLLNSGWKWRMWHWYWVWQKQVDDTQFTCWSLDEAIKTETIIQEVAS